MLPTCETPVTLGFVNVLAHPVFHAIDRHLPGADETTIDIMCPGTLGAAGGQTTVDLERNVGGGRIHAGETEITVAA